MIYYERYELFGHIYQFIFQLLVHSKLIYHITGYQLYSSGSHFNSQISLCQLPTSVCSQ